MSDDMLFQTHPATCGKCGTENIGRRCPVCGHEDVPIGEQLLLAKAEIERLRGALQAIVNRDPALPGPQGAALVTTSTLVAIARQALEYNDG